MRHRSPRTMLFCSREARPGSWKRDRIRGGLASINAVYTFGERLASRKTVPFAIAELEAFSTSRIGFRKPDVVTGCRRCHVWYCRTPLSVVVGRLGAPG